MIACLGPALRWRVARALFWLAFCGLLFLPATGLVSPLVLVNTGNSMPQGFYVHDFGASVHRGSVVALRNPPNFKLPWLLKQVEAVGGDRYCWRQDLGTHVIDKRIMPPPWSEAVKRGIPVWRGCKVLGPGEIVGYGRSVSSYDSRYFGPVQERQLWGIYRPVWLVD